MKIGHLIGSAVIAVWGAGIIVYALTTGGPHGTSAYQTGEVIALVFGAVILVAGIRGIRGELRKRTQ